jgi:cytochrome bd-type quinol oxidase subunit 2
MLIELWLDQPVWLLIGLLAAFFAATGALVFWLTQGRLTRRFAGSLAGVVAPFFGAVGVLFALLTGFLANDAWERNRQASRSVLTERDALVAIYDLSLATASDMSAIRTATRAYLEAVITDEWPLLRNGEASPKATEALRGLLRELSHPRLTTEAGAVAHYALLDQAVRARTARSDRLSLSEQYSDHPKWWTVLLLAVLTQVALALVHLDKPRAQAAALAVFSAAALLAIGLVAVKERPFDGPLAMQPTVLAEALRSMPAAIVAPPGPAPAGEVPRQRQP